MKHMRKLLAMVLAVMMVMSLATTAFAADVDKKDGVTGPASITVNLPDTSKAETANNTYQIYKVFDAATDATGTNISYTLVSGKSSAPAGFTVDTAGNVTYAGTGDTLTPADIEAIAAYVTEADLVATVTTTKDDASFTVTGLPYGYYYITTTTGTAVTVDSTKPNATVDDKNVVPSVDKKITGANSVDADGKKALAQIGTEVTFTGYITVGYGVENYVYYDTMSTGLTFKPESVTVKVGENVVDTTNYTLNTTNLNKNETFNVAFDNDYIAGLAKDTVITIEYKATITEAALTNDPETNTAQLYYGNDPDTDHTPPSGTTVYNAKFTVTKQDAQSNPLAGAGFVIKNAENKYYKLDNEVVTWVDSIDDATEYTSNAAGEVTAFTGLANGTYTLVEKTVPDGYNKASDFTFTIAEHDYTAANLEQATTVTNKAGTELPSTGGMGTTLFYVFGGIMMAAAVVLLVTKKRMADAE